MSQVEVPFTVDDWQPDPAPLHLGEAGPVALGRATMRKTYTGPLSGSSTVAMTSAAVGDSPVGYTALELVTGVLEGRSGTFVLQHSGVVDEGAPSPAGVVLPGTGTGELTGLRGSFSIEHGTAGPFLRLDYDLT